ncbi:hypothetical protein V6N12_035672 [Hibiscus sabdariffa]|uniref:RNase H type-1 domain-containing protein n=1 Tax=Hibiscus sabdariffa TaxID=183260 RepID=A0ABR2ENR5_9ROSI
MLGILALLRFEELFSPADRAAILSIRLPCLPQPDRLIWCGEKSGIYSVRNDYRFLLDNTATSPTVCSFYKHLWVFITMDFLTGICDYSTTCIILVENLLRTRFGRNGLHEIKSIHENLVQRAEELVTFVQSYDYNFRTLNCTLTHPSSAANVHWSPPPLGSCYRLLSHSFSAFMNEAFAVLHGLQFALDLGLCHDVKALSSSFVAGRFRFVPHACNCLAHAMAQEGRGKEEYHFCTVENFRTCGFR